MFEKELLEGLEGRKAYKYNYNSFWIAGCLKDYCCCFKNMDCHKKRVERLDLHDESVNRMQTETDIVGMVRSLRLVDFNLRTQLKQHQRYFVNKFMNYHIDADAEKNAVQVDHTEKEHELTEAGYKPIQYTDERIKDMSKKFDREC